MKLLYLVTLHIVALASLNATECRTCALDQASKVCYSYNKKDGFSYATSCCTSGCAETCLEYDSNHTSLALCTSTVRGVSMKGYVDLYNETEGDLVARGMRAGDVAVFRITPIDADGTMEWLAFEAEYADDDELVNHIYMVKEDGTLKIMNSVYENDKDKIIVDFKNDENFVVVVEALSSTNFEATCSVYNPFMGLQILGGVILILLILCCCCGCYCGVYIGYRVYMHMKHKQDEEKDKQERKRGWNYQLTTEVPQLNDPFHNLGKQTYAGL